MRTSVKKFILTLGISCVGLISFGQTVTIGYGTESSGLFPYYNSYRYAVTQSIYTASEIGNAGQIASIAYNVATASSYADQDVKIYMGHTALNTFASTASALTEDDLTLVYEGTLTLGTSTGWEKIYLKNVFEYNGVDNLVIAVARKTPENGTLNGTLEYYFSDGSTLNCNDNSDESFGEISHSMIGNWGSRPNIQIGFAPALVDEYYQIGDANDLLWFANYVNSGHATINGKLTADIDLTDVEWTPIDYEGTFDGNGDTIRNLTNNIGLFRTLDGGTIKNVSLVNSSITGTGFIGGIVGDMMSGTISKCCYKGTVSGVIAVGGIVGRCWSGRIENCYSMADVTATISNAGGICGYNADATITNTYVGKNKTITAGTENAGGICGYNEGTLTSCHTIDISSVSSPTYCGGLVGQDNGGTYSNCTYYQYAAMDGNSTRQNGLGNETAGSTTTNPTGISSKDSDFKSAVGSGNYCYLLNGSQNAGTVWKQTIGDDKYPVLDTTHLPVYKIGGRAYANKEITFSGGSGDPWTPFQISTAEELKNFAYLVNLGNSSLSGALTADIVLNENVLDENGNLRSDYKTANLEQWTPMSSFSGSFLGSNHTISGLYINSSLEKVGLFKEIISSGRVSYLGIVDSYISGSSYVGALAGQTYGATITSCYNTGVVEGSSFYVGGLIGMAGGTITNCYNTGNISSKGERVGGIGGCFGYYSGSATVTDCYNTGNVTSTSSIGLVGGLAGVCVNSTISFSKCYNTGTIIGKDKVGGCFGYLSSSSHSATNCYNTGSVVATGGDAGGVVASNAGKVSYCFNGGSVAGTENVGGVAATNTGTISYCYYNSDFCSHGGINSEDVANSAQALTSSNFTSSTLPTNFDSEVWTAGNTQGASASIISEDGILGYRIVGKYPSITGVGSAQEIVVKYVNVGTEKQPNWISNFIPIYTITDFKNIRYNLSATYVLMNDIVETENFSSLNVFTPTVTWPTIGPFTGKIYGNNHTVSGVYVKGEGSTRVGLINTADGALIRDLGLIKSKIQGEMPGTYAGGICGYMEGDATILNCYNSAEVIGMVAGGITSKGYHATITQCKNYGTITSMASEHADGIIGGIIGELYFTTVQQCYNEGTITSDLKAGGIAGEGGYDKIYNSYNAGAVSGQMAGGILGTKGTVGGHSNCLNIGNVSGTVNAGGVLGSGSASSGALYNCYYDINTSNIEGGIDGSDAQNMAEGIETDDLCLTLQAGFSSDIWAIKEPVIAGNKKYLYYPYLKCFGEESAKLATYRPISRVVLNQNGGTCTPLTQYIEREGATLPQDVVREGYTFGGWYTNASCTSDEFAEIPVTATGEQTFYAKWTANDYEVSLCANGGSINRGNVTSYTCGTYTTLPSDVTRTGYTFKGWYPALTCNVCDLVLDSVPPSSRGFAIILLYHEREFSELGISNQEAVEMVYNAPSVIASQISIDDAMYYKQKLEEYDAVVSLESFGLQEGELLCDLVLESYGSDKLNVVKIVRNYTGLGLLEAKNLVETAPVTILTQVPFATAQAMKDELDGLGSAVVSSFANNTGGQPISIIYPTDLGDKQFGAKWEANKYAVNLQENGGTNTKNIDEYTYGISVTLPDETEITREGYSFAGWYNNSNFSGSEVTKISSIEYGDKTFYAKWTPQTYEVLLNPLGGKINVGNITNYTYGTYTLLPDDVTRRGYTFKGWYPIQSCDVVLESCKKSVSLIEKVQDLYGISLSDAIDTVDKWVANVPLTIATNVSYDDAISYKKHIQSVDNIVSIESIVLSDGEPLCDLILENSGDNKVEVIKLVKKYSGLSLLEAKALVDAVPNAVLTQVPVETAQALKNDFDAMGDVVSSLENYTGATATTTIYPVDLGDKYWGAKWNVNSYSVNLQVNGGTNTNNIEEYTYGVGATLPDDTEITREGYTFAGWYMNSNYDGVAIEEISTTDFGDKTYYVKWSVNTYDVTLNTNGGTINSGNIASYTYGVGATLPTDVTKTGFTFLGWYNNSSCSGYPVLSIASNVADDKEFWAKWDTINYTITYNANEGAFATTPANSYKYGDEVILPTPTREGYEFGGWYNNSNLVGTEFTGIAATETGNKEFWAKWNVNSYTVSFETNGGTINNGNVKNYIYGTTVILPSDVTRTGFTFDGWYDNAEFEGERVAMISSVELGNKAFYANWIVNTYNVTLVTNEGTIAEEQNIERYEYGKGATLPTDVTKTGYTFDGWYGNTSYIGGTVSSIADNDMGDKQFWAKWTINEYEVAATAENGTVEGTGSYEYKSTATLKAIANEGYEFVGWNDNELRDERIQLTVTKDTTLVANFKEKEKVEIVGTLEIPTLKTEREAAPIDLAGLFTTTEGGEVTYSAASSAPNVVAATVSEGKLFLTVYEYEGESEITVTATLPNGEKNAVKATATVVLACNIQVEETITNVSCYGESDGEIALKVTNAAEPYTTLWTGATATTDTIKDVKAGNYEVVITDNENCTFTKTYTVSQPEEMKLSAKIKNPTCDNADGSITITLTGAENASFAWSNESTAQNVANLVKGDYSV
ncbi:MAG: ribosomal protein L7/L12, partial [Bacteroidales bacterium]|nr:ribosomal protein L7/L12 [Bacteroidales bacterium]